MDDPFDENGRISETARIVFDTDEYLAVLSQAKKGDADAQYQMGLWHSKGGNEAVGKTCLSKTGRPKPPSGFAKRRHRDTPRLKQNLMSSSRKA